MNIPLGCLRLQPWLRVSSISGFHTTASLGKVKAGKYKVTVNRTNPLTYEMSFKPDDIAHKKGFNSFNTAQLEGTFLQKEEIGQDLPYKTIVEDIFIRKFIHGTWPEAFASMVIIKRHHNIIRISGIINRKLAPKQMAGRGVDLKNEAEVNEYLENLGIEYRFGCYHEKNPKSCHLLGDYLEAIKQDFSKALRVYSINCESYNYGHSCHKVAAYKMIGRSCERNMDSAYDYYIDGCEKGHPRSCLHAAVLDTFAPGVSIKVADGDPGLSRIQAPNPKKAVDYFERACNADIGEACQRLANMYITGFQGAVEKNLERAFPLALKACEFGQVESCINVSVMYRKGEGVQQDLKLAEQFSAVAKDVISQMKENRERIAFQQGAETVG